tara:strand:- start:315 stop:641 length:327 start_codon:yes stop_codon:yes gene_type:complete
MKDRIDKEIGEFKKDFVVLFILPREHYEDVNMHLLKSILNRDNKGGAYVAINKPYSKLVEIMDRKGVDHSNLFFIDCVSSKSEKDGDNCVFLGTPSVLTELGITLNRC